MSEALEPNGKYELERVKVRLRLSKDGGLFSNEQIDMPIKAVNLVAQELAEMDREYFCVINLDAKARPINYNVVSIGDTSGTQVPIQNVFKTAILSNASRLIMLHNHPSGSMRPSEQDFSLTCHLVRAAKLMGIPIEDHIIVAGRSGAFSSMMTEFPELFVDAKGGMKAVAEQGRGYGDVEAGEASDMAYGGTRNPEEHENRRVRPQESRSAVVSAQLNCHSVSTKEWANKTIMGKSAEERSAGRPRGKQSLRRRLADKVSQAAKQRQNGMDRVRDSYHRER